MVINLIKKVCFVLILCFVSNKLTAQDGTTYFDRQPGNSLHAYQQYLKTNVQENINPATGGMTLVATDISLPGRNGLDLNINRVYRSRHLVAPYSSTEYNFLSDVDVIPQWSNMGMGWKCFMAVFERHWNGGASYPTATLYMGDGSVVEFISDNNVTYYTRGPEKMKVVMINQRPLLYLPDGTKYFFNVKSTLLAWGFFGDHYCVSKIEDTNGNYITIKYMNETNGFCTGTEIDLIVDTWGRRIKFFWQEDRIYSPIGGQTRYKLVCIRVVPEYASGNYLVSESIKSYNYIYGSLNFGLAEQNGVYYSEGNVTVLKAVFNEDHCEYRYDYGETNGNYYYDGRNCNVYNPELTINTSPNPNRGQLIKVSYATGKCDKYFYKFATNSQVSGSGDIYSVISAKGNSEHDDLWTFDYEPTDLNPRDGCFDQGFWTTTRVINRYDSLRTEYIYSNNTNDYYYPSYDGSLKVPIMFEKKEYYGLGVECRTTRYYHRRVELFHGWKIFPQLYRTEVKDGSPIISETDYIYYDDQDLVSYDNIKTVTEAGRKSEYTYLHIGGDPSLSIQYKDRYILDKRTSKTIYDQSGNKVYKESYEYDVLPVALYNENVLPDNYDMLYHNDNMIRGNLNRVGKYLDPKTEQTEKIINTYRYDECGNNICFKNGKGDSIIYDYTGGGQYSFLNTPLPDNVPGGGYYEEYYPNYRMKEINPEYGLAHWQTMSDLGQKIFEWTPQNGWTRYKYENYYLRPLEVIKESDNQNSPSITYNYQDRDRGYDYWDFSIPEISQLPPDSPVVFSEEKVFRNADEYTCIRKYYNREGVLRKVIQGDININYTFNSSGLLIAETAPYYAGQSI
ncbi:MAG: hypothetical protein ABIJ45_01145, partial [Candidatus Zixiibacteriota bacterium]